MAYHIEGIVTKVEQESSGSIKFYIKGGQNYAVVLKKDDKEEHKNLFFDNDFKKAIVQEADEGLKTNDPLMKDMILAAWSSNKKIRLDVEEPEAKKTKEDESKVENPEVENTEEGESKVENSEEEKTKEGESKVENLEAEKTKESKSKVENSEVGKTKADDKSLTVLKVTLL